MREVLIGKSASTYGIAFPSDLSGVRFSNCSALAFKTEENPFYTSSIVPQSYEDMLVELHSLRKDNVFIQGELEKHSVKPFTSEFSEYLDAKIIGADELAKIQYEYSNFGVCSSFTLNAIQTGEFKARILVDNLSLAENVEQYISVKILHPFRNIIDPAYFTFFKKDEVVLSMGSSYDWRFEHGPSQWESWRKINLETTVKKIHRGCEANSGLQANIPQHTSQGIVTQTYTLTCGVCAIANENSYSVMLFS